MDASEEDDIAAGAARLVVQEGMEYADAKRSVARGFSRQGARRPALPSDEQVED